MFGIDKVLLSQIFSFIGTVAIIIGMQLKKYDHIVLCKVINEFLCGIHYLLLGGYTGMLISFASCLTNGVYWYRNRQNKSTLVFQIIFGIAFVGIGIVSWHSIFSIFAVLAKLISSVSLGIKSPRTIRILNAISNPCWLVYNFSVGSVVAVLSAGFATLSVIVGIIRLDIFKKGEKE